MLVVGLGGGSLPLFVHDYFSQARVAVVEIDPSMLEVATQWFGFCQGDRMQVHVCDGLDYVAKVAAEGTISQSIPHQTQWVPRWGAEPWAVVTPCFLSLPITSCVPPSPASPGLCCSQPVLASLRFVASPSTKGLLGESPAEKTPMTWQKGCLDDPIFYLPTCVALLCPMG